MQQKYGEKQVKQLVILVMEGDWIMRSVTDTRGTASRPCTR